MGTMREVPLTDRAGLAAAPLAALRAEVSAQRTLADVLAWARGRRPPAEIMEIVTQDEYTHDVVLGDGAGDDRIYLVYDTT